MPDRLVTALLFFSPMLFCVRALPIPEIAADSGRLVADARHFRACHGAASSERVHISSLTFEPYPARPGSHLLVTVKGVHDDEIKGGRAELRASYYGMPVASFDIDLCSDFGLSCPHRAGSFQGTLKYQIPQLPISGITLDLHVDVLNAAGVSIGCIRTEALIT